jgi:hypothetical protein
MKKIVGENSNFFKQIYLQQVTIKKRMISPFQLCSLQFAQV